MPFAGNLAATAFPLFTNKMYHNLGYNWANTLFGFIGVIMIPIPFVRTVPFCHTRAELITRRLCFSVGPLSDYAANFLEQLWRPLLLNRKICM